MECISTRLQSKVHKFMINAEQFVTEGSNISDELAYFYKDELDRDSVVLHRFLGKTNCLYKKMLPDFVKLIRLMMIIPVSVCTIAQKRSFSCLWRLKTCLESTTTQSQLNTLALLNNYSDVTI